MWAMSGRETPVEVIGELPAKDVAEIKVAVKRKMRRDILPNLSWESFKHMPKAIKEYSSIKLIHSHHTGVWN